MTMTENEKYLAARRQELSARYWQAAQSAHLARNDYQYSWYVNQSAFHALQARQLMRIDQ